MTARLLHAQASKALSVFALFLALLLPLDTPVRAQGRLADQGGLPPAAAYDADAMTANLSKLNRAITVDLQEVPVKKALLGIAAQGDMSLIFNEQHLASASANVTLAAETTVLEALYEAVRGTDRGVQLTSSGRLVVVKRDGREDRGLQTGTIAGRVIEAETEEPLPGVNVFIEGTTMGASTGADGQYEITGLEPGTYDVQASFIGYQSRVVEDVEVADDEVTVLDFALQASTIALDEVVAVGYGEQQRRDITGAVSTISAEEVQTEPTPSIEGALQGRVAGLQVRQRGGSLEGDFEVLIRGTSSLGNTQPLFVVDGVPLFSGSLSTLNLGDVESVQVLKDASATAIYGARAANGVVLVQTTRGIPGETRVHFSAEAGLQQATQTVPLMNSQQFAELFKESYINAGRSLPSEFDDPTFPSVYNDWQDLILRTAPRQQLNMSVTGGDQRTQFAVTGGYTNVEGILISSSLQRLSLRANLDHEVNERLNVGVRLSGSRQYRDHIRDDIFFGRSPFRGAIINKPWIPYKDENGDWAQLPQRKGATFGFVSNPVAWALRQIRDRYDNRFLGSAFAQYELVDGLRYEARFGTDMLIGDAYNYWPVWEKGGNFARSEARVEQSESTEINWVVDQTLTYTSSFRERHSVTGLLGFTMQEFTTNFLSVAGTGTTDIRLREISNQPTIQGASGGTTEAGLLSYFARLNYDYDDTYLLTATVRRDGSSRFGADRRFGTFPSVAVGWRVSEEPFMQGLDVVEDLKLRASYGLTGDQSIGNFRFLARANTDFYAWGNEIASGIAPVSYAKPNLHWEANEQFDVGFDLTLFNYRLSMTADYYNKVSDGLLVDIPVPPSNGIVTSEIVNLGSIRNTGFEFALTSRNLTGAFSWSTSFNITTNANEVLDIGTTAAGEPLQIYGPGLPSGEPIHLTTAGYPIGAFYTLIMDGIWQFDEAAEAAAFGAVPGDVRFRDVNGDGQLTAADRTFVGQSQPAWYGGLSNSFSYRGLRLSVFLDWQAGHKLWNSERLFTEGGFPNMNQRVSMLNRWTEENPSNKYPKVYAGGPRQTYNWQTSTRFLEDASYLRVNNISLGYSLPDRWVAGLNIERAELVLSATNLFTFTRYEGLDPEASSRNSPLAGGLDQTPYPLAEAYSLRMNLTF